MTREEAIKELELYRGTTAVIEISEEAYNMAIELLKEQTIPLSVIEEIKAEIEKQGVNSGMLLALKIIDEKVKEYTDDM